MTRPLSLEDLSDKKDFGGIGGKREWRKQDSGRLLKQ